MKKSIFLLFSVASFMMCFFANQSYAQSRGTGTTIYNKSRPYGTGVNTYHFTRARVSNTFDKGDCEYQIKLCLDEYCYDEYDGYKNCRDNSIEDFQNVVSSCFKGLPSSSRVNYTGNCKNYIAPAVTSYVKQMKEFLNYQTTMKACDEAKDMVRAAQACYGIAITKGANSWNKDLKNSLNKACGPNVVGGSEIMVEEFYNAGYMGTDGAGWIANFGMLNFSSKKTGWEKVVDAILARYIDLKKTECGEGEYVVSQVGQATSELKSSGDALRAGVVAGVLQSVQSSKEAKEEIKNTQIIYINVSSINNYQHGDLASAVQHLSSSNRLSDNAEAVRDILKYRISSLKNGGVIVAKTLKGCYAYDIKNATTGSIALMGTDNMKKFSDSNEEFRGAMSCK